MCCPSCALARDQARALPASAISTVDLRCHQLLEGAAAREGVQPTPFAWYECGRRHLTGHVPYCTRVIENNHSWPRTGSRPSAARAPTAKRVPSFRPRQAAVTQYSHFCARWASLGRQSLPTRADPSEEAADVALREKQRTRCRTRRAPSSVSGDSSPLLTTSSNSTLSIVGWGDLGIGRRPGSRCIGHGYPSVATD